jgi:membrane protease YdiL (CAAX protease family)
MLYAALVFVVTLIVAAIVYLNERHGLLSCDRFQSTGAKWFAYIWLWLFFAGISVLVAQGAQVQPTASEIAKMPFYSVFQMHLILVVFLIGWWAAAGRPEWREFLNVRHERPAEVVAIGISVGVGGWIVTLLAAMLLSLLLQATGAMTEAPEPPVMIGYLSALPLWQKALIVLSAMTVEEAFFRSFLQKRIGLIASTLLFALAHFTYGNPLMLVGITVVSIIIGITFHRTKNVIPGVLAHGVFDAIQLFVIVPIAYKMLGVG